jgi:general secretion pathway protein K
MSARPRMNVRQRGVAILTALILVAIAAIVATAILWQSTLAWRRGTAVYTVAESLALAQLAEAGGAQLLRDNRNKNPLFVAPNQAWAKPYGPFEIDGGPAKAVLELAIEDQAGKFNLNGVVMSVAAGAPQAPGAPQPPAAAQLPGGTPALPASIGAPLIENSIAVEQFKALLAGLNIDTSYAERLVDWIDTDDQPTFPGGAEDSYYMAQQPPHRVPNMPITSISELLAMGMDRASYERLAPFVTALPPNTKLNICTAPGEVLDAIAGERNFSQDPKGLIEQRQQFDCYPNRAAFLAGVASSWKNYVPAHIDTRSSWFRLRTWITIGTTRFTLYSLINQDASGQIRPVLRTFGTE